jgi:uncharacterized protein (TIGR02147 family)
MQPRLAGLPSVYEYLDYREYLRAYYAASKRSRSAFSFRFFARHAGLSSPNFLKLVMDGKRNLGPTTVPKFCKALGLGADEASFFGELVALSQAETVAERNRAFDRVAANRRFRAARRLEGPLFKYLTHWYYPAIRELAGRLDFVEDPAWIAEQLLPRIERRQARDALAALIELGLLVRDERGRLVRGEPSLTTGHEVRSVAVRAFHRQMIELAARALDAVPPEERDVSALTVCISAATVADLKTRIHRFREELLERSDSDAGPERVYQICIQLFPLSHAAEVRIEHRKLRTTPPLAKVRASRPPAG